MNRTPDLATLHATGLDGWDDKLLNWIVDVRLACLIKYADFIRTETT